MSKLNARLGRIERMLCGSDVLQCPLCNWQVIITGPTLDDAPAHALHKTANHWPDCFDEGGHCRRCGREADRIVIVVPRPPPRSAIVPRLANAPLVATD